MSKIFIKYLLVSFLGASLLSCNSNLYLTHDQSLIKKSTIIFKNGNRIDGKSQLNRELENLITSKPNRKFLFFVPKEYLYLRFLNAPTAIENSIAKLGEPPVLYNSNKITKTVKELEDYLKYKKGYYHAKVDYYTEEKNFGMTTTSGTDTWENIHVYYVVSTGERYRIKSIKYLSKDNSVLSLLDSIKNESFIEQGDYLDYNTFELEKSRLTVALQNNGFINFSNNFIEFEGDSSVLNKEIDLTINILTPTSTTNHLRFTSGNINVYTDYIRGITRDSLATSNIGNIDFYRSSNKFLVNPRLLNNSIFIKEEKLVSRENIQKTFRKLNNLGTYRFVNINPTTTSASDSIMNFDIFLTPYPNKWIFDGGFQAYYSTLGSADLLGVSLTSQFINRNLFGGSERYTLRLEVGNEIGYTSEQKWISRTNSFVASQSLNIPSFQDFLGLGKMLNKLHIIHNKFYTNFNEQAFTNISMGLSQNNILGFYRVQSYATSFGFDYTSPSNNRYVFRPLGFNLDLYNIQDSSRFNSRVLLSFKNIMATGFLFRDVSTIHSNLIKKRGHTGMIINNLEVSGWEVFLLNKAFNGITGKNQIWHLPGVNDIKFAKFAKYTFDGRYSRELSKFNSIATRFYMGFIVPFGDTEAAPFIRQFGGGGPNSLRAWNFSEPGPGGFRNPEQTTQIIFVNQGDFKLELNAEYRFKLVWKLDGALFADIGNIWMFKADENRPEAHLTKEFYNQLAMGVGYGLRLNFDIFIIRFDFGYKIRNPYRSNPNGGHWNSWRGITRQGLGNVQVGVNYPF